MSELVTVIVPVYQAEHYLDRCVLSILGQTYRNLEIILVDDGSKDSSGWICDGYAREDQRIQVIHKENGGVASARNAGFDRMSGSFLLMVDADDYIKAEMIDDLLAAMKDGWADLAICGFSMVFENGSEAENHSPQLPFCGTREEFVNGQLVDLYDKLLINNQNNKLYSVDLIKTHNIRYDETMSINEDTWFSLTMIGLSQRIVCIPDAYLYYWQYNTPQSLVTRFNDNGVETCFVLKRSVDTCLNSVNTLPGVRNEMNNRMIFNICGFAGLMYYRSSYSKKKCRMEIRKLTKRPEFQKLLRDTIPEDGKNKAAAWVLGHGWSNVYHGLCLLVYHKQRTQHLKEIKRG